MGLSALEDLSITPDSKQVAAVLGSAIEAWSSLEGWLTQEVSVDGWEWGSSGKNYGWGLRAKIGKRTIVYMIPQQGAFLVGLVLGDRAMEAVHESSFSPPVQEVIAGAKRYGEGTGFRVPVATLADLDDIRTLIEIKVNH